MGYPPEPWHLRGRMHVSVWALPVAQVPPIPPELATAVRVVTIGSRAFIGTAWVAYEPGGDMSYNELLAAVLVRAGLRPRVTITHIWVDSIDSRDGGRALWGIPKELATFALTAHDARADTPETPLAASTWPTSRRLPMRWPISFRVTQAMAGVPKTTVVRAKARVGFAAVTWHLPTASPLSFLTGRKPLLSVVASDFRMRFGHPTV